MKSICINYLTHLEKGDENNQLVAAIFKQLQEFKITGVKYAAFKMGGNVFIHIAKFQDEEVLAEFQALPAFGDFQKTLANRLASQPIITPVLEIGTITTLNDSHPNKKKIKCMPSPTHLLIHYSVSKESVALIRAAIADTFEELNEVPVENLFYSVYQVGSNSFTHLQCFPSEAAGKYILSLSSFKEFLQKLEYSFEQEPMAYNVENIGYYNTLN